MRRLAVVGLVVLAAGCQTRDPAPPRAPGYRVTCLDGGVLEVSLWVPLGQAGRWEWAHGREGVESLSTEPEAAFEATASGVTLAPKVREVRYRYRLAGGADLARGAGGNGAWAVDAESYLLLPRDPVRGLELDLRSPGAAQQLPRPDGRYLLEPSTQETPGLHVHGVSARTLERGGLRARWVALTGGSRWSEPRLEAWLAKTLSEAASVVPWLRDPLIALLPRAGAGEGAPTIYPGAPPAIAQPLGQATVDFSATWALLRGLCLAALPEAAPEERWLSEGAATYLQHLASWRSGRRTAAETLGRLRDGMIRAAAGAGRDSLRLLARSDGDAAYAASYWGGALLLLDLDLELHARGEALEEVLAALAARGQLSEAALRAEVEARCPGVFAPLALAHLEGPALRATNGVFQRLGLERDGSLSASGAAARASLASPSRKR
ncbi:MAG: hypothetical protein R3F62_28715 [Planctomycetota bacterium]